MTAPTKLKVEYLSLLRGSRMGNSSLAKATTKSSLIIRRNLIGPPLHFKFSVRKISLSTNIHDSKTVIDAKNIGISNHHNRNILGLLI